MRRDSKIVFTVGGKNIRRWDVGLLLIAIAVVGIPIVLLLTL
jgi:hypothetical protein